ncbi:Fe(3+) ions import ATP-binding protein FbpC [Pseudidiomarina piscicola]|uniref:Fe(3+) ions import ATP-binding protein FbpC n=1 Tax=Pseudidiomarina piscicola TaxID=2614830 RepID=A0A6S6WTN4_9GAMM|nr:ATP-binding cassette domain-containing protein [Pseudidiomarina piscicola]CAB0150057.1 Fe(3+) ions import ATP-binding protein FbpC [Pseudidiomarina piscicola]VZT39500.1 Fe(3+) ions import ATP-binding protein FbpC [Pseudomonas aeruginosa]
MISQATQIALSDQCLTWRQDGRTQSLPDMNLTDGASLGVMGPSGCGKSSWLRCLLGETLSYVQFSGRIAIAGKDVSRLPIEQRGIGILMQDNPLFPHYSVAKNLAFALQRQGLTKAAQKQVIETQLAELGLADMAERLPGQLSGGQQARIGLLRTVLAEPALVLLDEPFNALDAERRQQVRDWTFNFLRERGIAAIIVSHQADDLSLVDQQLYWPDIAVEQPCEARTK